VEGHLTADWVDWPFEVENRHEYDGEGAITIMIVTLPDQPALHGMLQTIRDLNLKLISVQLVPESK